MTIRTRALLPTLALLGALAPAAAQEETKPDESATYRGFTGLFNLVSPDTLDRGQVSFGLVHHNYDRELTDLDVNDATAVFAIGVTRRLELGFAYVANRQMDYDDPTSGAFYNNFPFPVTTIDNGGGDLFLGLKWALARIDSGGFGLSLFGDVKVPTANEERGRGTGSADVRAGLAAGLLAGPLALYGNGAFTYVGEARSDLGDLDLANMVGWGLGAELGARAPVRGIVELTGEHFVNEEELFLDRFGEGEQESSVVLTAGFKLGGPRASGFTFGAAYTRNLTADEDRERDGAPSRPSGFIAELTFTSARADEVPAPPPPPPPPVNNPPTCTLTVTPEEVFPAASPKPHTATAAVQASDPDGDALSYSWSASGGTVSGSGASVTWTPPAGTADEPVEEGTFTVTVRVSDGKGGETTCSDAVRLKPDPEHFEGRVQFEFDRYDLTDDARDVIRRAAEHLKRHPALQLAVEGHACYIATEEYNFALGQQRSEAIREHLGALGVDAARISTISYGETRPWQDNTREITRRLNRRGEFRFRFTE